MEKEQRVLLLRIAVSAALLGALHFLPLDGWLKLALYLIPYFIVGYDVLKEAAEGIAHGEIFDENFLMAIATIGAFALGDYAEACFVMLFFGVGELFEDLATDRSRRSISELVNLRPDTANVERDGEIVTVSPKDVALDEVIVVKPGEKIPLDGIVLSGTTSLDTAALTGEAMPRDVGEGDAVLSGCVNLSGVIRVRVTKAYADSVVAKILEMMGHCAEGKARSERFITRFARRYTPIVVCSALALAIIPSLFTGAWDVWTKRALSFLIISCPCALVVSVPLAFFAGVGGASRRGILIKHSGDMEVLSAVKAVALDKTGTLTQGRFEVVQVCAERDEQELVKLAACAECYSDHPVAVALKSAYGKAIDATRIGAVEELAGHGVRAVVDGRTVLVGNARLMRDNGIDAKDCGHIGTVIHAAADGAYLGHITIADCLKPDAKSAVCALRKCGVRQITMLTGDSSTIAQRMADTLRLDAFYAECLPDQKVQYVEQMMSSLGRNEKLAFVGDGINDAPVMARADVGIAMGGIGSDAAVEAADVVLMNDRPSDLPAAMIGAKRTLAIVRQNIVFAIAIKALVMAASVFGLVGIGWAVFADVGSMVLTVLNASRAWNAFRGGK